MKNEPAIKRKCLILALIGILIAIISSGTGGLAIILDVLYKLFRNGTLSQATYERLVKAAIASASKCSCATPGVQTANYTVQIYKLSMQLLNKPSYSNNWKSIKFGNN